MAIHNEDDRNIPWLWIGLGLALIALMAAWFFLPVSERLKSFNQWIESLGVWGYVIFAAVYIVATVLLAPGSPLTIAAGLVFSGWGFPLVVIAATVGAALAFLVARYLARARVERMTENRPKFKAVDQAVTEDGWKVVMLLRLSPVVPFNLQNYFFGVTDVKFWHYVAATFVGIIATIVVTVLITRKAKARLDEIGLEAGSAKGSSA
ncbi:MAG: TVP38/TMEM64 family protein [Gammaproteobacteria bacterium]|nr:TVP38/TMEM64 family protein [Gammaproteobacteria bacterium]